MKRAAILIGVDRAGSLPTLNDAARGARRMEAWAQSQGMAAQAFTDENGGVVDIGDIKKAIRKLVADGIEQLFVYFAGHGVNIRYGEYWLLSAAPADPQAAVNVAGSVELARRCGIVHVVLLSDACRTAAEGIAAQNVTGSEIFPNDAITDLEQPVDQFWACTLGRPANEIRDPIVTTREYTAVYTKALVPALAGTAATLLEVAGVAAPSSPAAVGAGADAGLAAQPAEVVRVVRPRSLKAYLQARVPAALQDAQLHTRVIQVPDARITSGPDAWLARFTSLAHMRSHSGPVSADPPPVTIESVSRELMTSALQNVPLAAHNGPLAREAAAAAQPFGPDHFETGCGFKLRNMACVRAVSRLRANLLDPSLVRIEPFQGTGAPVLLEFANGTGAALPAIPGFLASLTWEADELVHVAYEPTNDGGTRWLEFARRADEVRTLRAIAAVSVRAGMFRLDAHVAAQLAGRMQHAKGLDPSLAVYAAYAYDAMQLRERLRELERCMRDHLGTCLFDIGLLAGSLDRQAVPLDYLPQFPLLSQGWATLSARRVARPPSLAGIERHLLSSVWTTFDSGGVQCIEAAIRRGEL